MMDYHVFETLKLFESMTGKSNNYLVNAVMGGNVDEIKISFERQVDSNGVVTVVTHVPAVHWKA